MLIRNCSLRIYNCFAISRIRRRSAAARLLRLWVRIPPGAWMYIYFGCRVLSGRVLSDEPITRPEQSYWLWCVVVCDLETSWMRRPWPTGGSRAKNKQTIYFQNLSYSLQDQKPLHINDLPLFTVEEQFITSQCEVLRLVTGYRCIQWYGWTNLVSAIGRKIKFANSS